MNVILLIFSAALIFLGSWLIPFADHEAIRPSAPYRCILGLFFMFLGSVLAIVSLVKP